MKLHTNILQKTSLLLNEWRRKHGVFGKKWNGDNNGNLENSRMINTKHQNKIQWWREVFNGAEIR